MGSAPAGLFRAAGDTVRTNVTALVRQLQALRADRVNVIVVGYWNVVLDGDVGLARYGVAGLRQAHEATYYANQVLVEGGQGHRCDVRVEPGRAARRRRAAGPDALPGPRRRPPERARAPADRPGRLRRSAGGLSSRRAHATSRKRRRGRFSAVTSVPSLAPEASADRAVDEVPARSLRHAAELVAFRRDLHAHPELGYAGDPHHPPRARAARRGRAAPRGAPRRHGPGRDVGSGRAGVGAAGRHRRAADPGPQGGPYRSTDRRASPRLRARRAHVGGARRGLALAELDGRGCAGPRTRLIFQPAEEPMPGGALTSSRRRARRGRRIFALHCDPRSTSGRVGLREGPITAACDQIEVGCTVPGGHTARPHLTADLVYALGKVVTELPAALRAASTRAPALRSCGAGRGRRGAQRDPASAASSRAPCACSTPRPGRRPALVDELVEQIVAPYGVDGRGGPITAACRRSSTRPPCVEVLAAAARRASARGGGPTPTEPRRRGLRVVPRARPGALARLGTPRRGAAHRRPAPGRPSTSTRAHRVGARFLAAASLLSVGPQPRLRGFPGERERLHVSGHLSARVIFRVP